MSIKEPLILFLPVIVRANLFTPVSHRSVLLALASVPGRPFAGVLVKGLGGSLLLDDALGLGKLLPFGHVLGLWNLEDFH